MDFLLILLQLFSAFLVAPLFDGIARKLRAKFQSRIGPNIFQTYYDILKLAKRGRTKPECSSLIYQISPYLLFLSSAIMFCLLPVTYGADSPFARISDVLLFIYIAAMFRFIFIISGIDTGNAFGAVGSSREATIGVYSECIVIMCLVVVMLGIGTSNLVEISNAIRAGEYGYFIPSFAIASTAFIWMMYVETGRKPYDLAEAEQELQEGVLGEYSGKDLSIMGLSLMLKQFSMLGLFLVIFEPWNFDNPILALIVFILEIGILYVLVVFIDNFGPRFTMSKGVRKTLIFPFAIACSAIFCFILGV
ncbi:respiratory chain complex I subunit 1 family protein [Campylobacter sputorum]|uniref:respiratory chain complex I subunit 1 family protein n=1 Tax=Campylobacter sputorum TaxID=206 RepID=UPI00053C04F9|nr:NADH-quinone oxidoreductase subunit H [Campylobacter sputorum]